MGSYAPLAGAVGSAPLMLCHMISRGIVWIESGTQGQVSGAL